MMNYHQCYTDAKSHQCHNDVTSKRFNENSGWVLIKNGRRFTLTFGQREDVNRNIIEKINEHNYNILCTSCHKILYRISLDDIVNESEVYKKSKL